MGMPEIVKPDRRHAGLVDDSPERFVDRMGMHDLAIATGEHPLLGAVDTDRRGLGCLERPPPSKDLDVGVVERDGAPGSLGLVAGLVNLVAHRESPRLRWRRRFLKSVPDRVAHQQSEFFVGQRHPFDALERVLLGWPTSTSPSSSAP